MTEGDWDPPQHERLYFRSAESGQLGWQVVRGGKVMVRYDRPDEEILRPYNAAEWVAEKEHRPITRAQAAQVAFEADRKLCVLLGQHDPKRRDWSMMHEDARIKFVDEGPLGPPAVRMDVFRAIMSSLDRVSR
jgi:hypothetical protein